MVYWLMIHEIFQTGVFLLRDSFSLIFISQFENPVRITGMQFTLEWIQILQGIPIAEGLRRIEAAHGFYITFAGMMAVFTGLVVLWLSVMLFRKILAMPEQIRSKSRTEIDSSLSPIAMVKQDDELKVVAMIGALIAYMEEYETDPVKTLPLKTISQEMSPWVMVAREQMLRK